MAELTGVYAAPYFQDYGVVKLCVSFVVGMTKERFVHVEVKGPPVLEDQGVIEDFAEVKILGQCDKVCRTGAIQPGAIRKIFPVGPLLAKAITEAAGFRAAIS